MSKSGVTEAQMIEALRQMEAGRTAADIGRQYGVSKHTIYAWKAKYGGLAAISHRMICVKGWKQSSGDFGKGLAGSHTEARLRAFRRARVSRNQAARHFRLARIGFQTTLRNGPGVDSRSKVLLELSSIFQQRRFIHTC